MKRLFAIVSLSALFSQVLLADITPVQAGSPIQKIAILQDNTSIAELYVKMGRLSWRNKDFPKAIELLTKAINAKPQCADAYFWRGMSHDSLKEGDLAIADFDRAIEADKTYGKAYFVRGLNYGTKKNYDLAISDLEIASKLLRTAVDGEYAAQAEQFIKIYRTVR